MPPASPRASTLGPRCSDRAKRPTWRGTSPPPSPTWRASWRSIPNDRLIAYVLPYLGDIALSNHDFAAAAGYFRDGLKRFPDGQMQDDCRFGLGRALEKQNQTEEAERLFLAVAGKPGSPLADAAQFHLGALQYAAGRYDQALESFAAFEDRLAASSWQPNARLGRGLALLKLNRPAEAVKQFDAVLATPSAGAELFQQAARGKVQAALQMKDYAAVDRDVADFRAAVRQQPARRRRAADACPFAGRTQGVRPSRRPGGTAAPVVPSPKGRGDRTAGPGESLLAGGELRGAETLRRSPGRAAAGG